MQEKPADVVAHDDYDLRDLVVAPRRLIIRKDIIDGLDEYFSLETDYLEWLAAHPQSDLSTRLYVQSAPLQFLHRRPDICKVLTALRSGDIKLFMRAVS